MQKQTSMCLDPHLNYGWGWRAVIPVWALQYNILNDRSKAVLLLWNIYVISVLFLLCFHVRLFIDGFWSPAEKGLTPWLSFVMSNCEVVTFPMVSWVRCCACLYRLLIFTLFLTIGTVRLFLSPLVIFLLNMIFLLQGVSFVFFVVAWACLCCVLLLFLAVLWSSFGKWLTSWLSRIWCFVCLCNFPILCPG